jgi:polyisoprenoid-binding protein YceI
VTAPVTGIPGYVAGTWDMDPVDSHVGSEAWHMFVSKVRGRFETFTGQIITADPLQSSATLTVQMSSVTTGSQTRDDDLRSDNFLAAATYPVMTCRSAGIRRDRRGFVLDGELTICGVTLPISLTFEISGFTADPAGGGHPGRVPRGRPDQPDGLRRLLRRAGRRRPGERQGRDRHRSRRGPAPAGIAPRPGPVACLPPAGPSTGEGPRRWPARGRDRHVPGSRLHGPEPGPYEPHLDQTDTTN